MKYKLEYVVWEITRGCNMRCQHCGSSCTSPLADELTTREALNVCDELYKMGVKFVTLTGGEPTTRPDWHIIAKRLTDYNINTSIISNGWSVDEGIIKKIKDSKIAIFAISIDGMENTHDSIRKVGSFKKDIKAIREFKKNGIRTLIATTINSSNISEIEEMYDFFEKEGVDHWQLQITFPMGNALKHEDIKFSAEMIDVIIEFAYTKRNGRMKIHFTDGIGYYNQHQYEMQDACWTGCTAGKKSLGIMQNGDIVGCTSIRTQSMVEGNIRYELIESIWGSPTAFSWNREMTKEKLGGFCKKCQFADKCLGGCSNSRYTLNGEINSENRYCSFNYQMKKVESMIQNMDEEEKEKLFYDSINGKLYQIAELVGEKLILQQPDNSYFKQLYSNVTNKLA